MGHRSPGSAAVVLLVLLAGASRVAAQNVTDDQIEELIQQTAARATMTPRPASAPMVNEAPAPEEGIPPLELTLQDAIQMALEHNLDIAVQRLTPQTYDYSLAALRSAYRPTLTSTMSRESRTTPSTQTISGAAVGTGIRQTTHTYNTGLSQSLPWGGSSLTMALNNNRNKTTSLNALFDPAFNANWSATFTQPLLRDRRIDNTREQILITGLNQDISRIQLQATVINTLSNVSNAYWDYVYAVQFVDVMQQSVQLADQLVRDNETRVSIGTMAPMDVVQAQAAAATQRQNLTVAEGNRRTAELALKRLIVGGTDDPTWSATIDPVDRPDFAAQTVDIDEAVETALANRTDLQAVHKNLEVNDVTLKYLKNQTLPTVDLSARYQLVGQGGTRFISTGSGVNRVVSDTIPGGYSDALSTLWDRNYPTWNVTLTASFPIGTSAQDAARQRAQLQARQVEAQLKQIQLQVATEVTNAGTQVQNNVERVQAAQAARELAERQLEAEQSKFDLGMSTNYFIVQAQRDLATAQNNELQAILAYRRSLVEFERLQQTSLSNSNITILGR